MIKLEINEVLFIHKALLLIDIKGAEAPFVTKLLTKIVNEANKLQIPPPPTEPPSNTKKSK
mgnify:CR=1 FL=1|tara:strand:+ start:1634 stop:1816 length:183 start_codon:yes stop_codon:yes gene_type:complete